MKKRYDSDVSQVSFRSKDSGWGNYSLKVLFENGEMFSQIGADNIYTKGFMQNLTLRPSCYNCSNKETRSSDITLADFWGIKNVLPQWYSEEGVSLVIIHTQKGLDLVNAIDDVEAIDVNGTTVYCFSQVKKLSTIAYLDGLTHYTIQIPTDLETAKEIAKTIK